MRYLYSLSLVLAFSLQAFSQQLVSAQFLSNVTKAQLRFLTPAADYDVDAYKIVYNTTDIDGSPTIASGALMIPVNTTCDQFPLVSYNHGTVLMREDVPSRDNGEALIPKLMASVGKVAVCPDYLGLGDNPGLHPYLHAESEATATLDLIRAAREFINDSLTITLNGEVFITGYSQGGHAAMATAKYIQDNNLGSEFNIVAAGPASGPYNLSGTQSETLLSNAPYSNPGYVCYLLFGLNRVYGDLFTTYSDILKSPYDQIIPPYFDGTYPMDSVNAQLPARLGDFMQDTVLANFANAATTKNHPLWQALIKNDNYDWAPAFPMEMYYCTQDEQVTFGNSLDADSAMKANGATMVSAVNKGSLSHGGCVFPSLDGAIALFESLETPCQFVSLTESYLKEKLQMFPNPSLDRVSINGLAEDESVSVELYDLKGRMVKSFQTVKNNDELDVSDLISGVYLVRVENNQVRAVSKFLKL